MIARGFKSVIWVATVGGAALSCYMVSLRVATERAELAKVERQIVTARRDIRALQTELGTRGRMSQLEQWNAEVLALSAPTASQFLRDEVTLARFEQNQPTIEERSAEVRMASAEVPPAAAAPTPAAPVLQAVAPAQPSEPAVRRASFTPVDQAARKPATEIKPAAQAAARKDAAESAPANAAARTKPASAQAKLEPKGAGAPAGQQAKPAAKPAATAAKAPAKTSATASATGAKAPAKAAATAAKAPAERPRASKIDARLASDIEAGAKAQGSGGN